MSADNKSCSTSCLNAELLKDKKCINEEKCSGDNDIVDQTADQRECKDKTAEGYSCPFESADGRRCVKSCLSIE